MSSMMRILLCALAWSWSWSVPVMAESERVEMVSWAPASGPQALWIEAAGGLQTAAGLFNAHGGIGGRSLALDLISADEDSPDFMSSLARRMEKPSVAGVVGGPVHSAAGRTADYLRQIKRPWLGPWSSSDKLYQGLDSDPFAVLPNWRQEMPALLDYVKAGYAADPAKSGPVFLVYFNFPDDQAMAAEVKQMAEGLGLVLKRAPINPDFGDWPFLAQHVQGSGAVIIWLTQGRTAAFVKAAKTLTPEAIYLTSSVNPTNRNLVIMSGGAWNGMIFPAVLAPSQEIPKAYDTVIRKYGPVGLEGGYQTYLGFAQGQILARAFSLDSGAGPADLTRGLYNLRGFSTLLAEPAEFSSGRHMDAGRFYLGRAYGNGQWERAPAPGSAFVQEPTR